MTVPPPCSPKVLCVSSYFPEHGGGVERIAHDIAHYFADRLNWQTALAASATDGTAETVAWGYARIAVRCWNGLETATGFPLIIPHPFDLVRLLRRIGDHDLIVVHEEIYLTSLLSIIWALMTGVPLVVVKHTGIVPLKSRPVLEWTLNTFVRVIGRPLLRRAARVVFVTQAKRENYDPDQTIGDALVIPNGIDTELFAPSPTGPDERSGIVFVGRFIESKGLGVLRQISAELKDVPFTIAGWGPDSPESWGHDNVTVMWRPPRPEIARALAGARLALVPGNGEGIPLVALEALSCGTRTMIGAASNRHASVVSSHLVAVPVDFDNVAQTAAAWTHEIRTLLQQPDDMAAEQERHAAIAATQATRVMCEAYADLILRVLDTHHHKARRTAV